MNVNPVGPSTYTVRGRSSACCSPTGSAPTGASSALVNPADLLRSAAFQPACNRQPASAEWTSVKRSPLGPLSKMVGAAFCVSGEANTAWPNTANVPAVSAVLASTAVGKRQDIGNVRERFIITSFSRPGKLRLGPVELQKVTDPPPTV